MTVSPAFSPYLNDLFFQIGAYMYISPAACCCLLSCSQLLLADCVRVCSGLVIVTGLLLCNASFPVKQHA